MAMGEVLNKQGVKKLYLMAPNYAAGKDMTAGVERTFKGEIVGKDLRSMMPWISAGRQKVADASGGAS